MDRGQVAPLLDVNLSAGYPARPRVLDGVRFSLDRGEIVGLIGPSGSGKSTVALAVLRLLELRGGTAHGSIRFDGRELMELRAAELRRIRGKGMALVMQSPVAALNPALRIETQLREMWRAHEAAPSPGRSPPDPPPPLLERIGLPAGDEFLRRYPRELSVGQAQRVAIAMAVMHRPKLLIADEPTSALDPGSRNGILELFEQLNAELGISILYVSHDLASVERLCRRAGVLEGGRLARWETPGRGLINLDHALSADAVDSRGCASGATAAAAL
jgi:ABC-type glutathione transport system ATPase component